MSSIRQNRYVIREARDPIDSDDLPTLKAQLEECTDRFSQFDNADDLDLLSVDRIYYIAEQQGFTELMEVLDNEQYNELLVRLYIA